MDSPKTAIKAGGKSIGSKSQLSGVRALLNFEELENVS
jgi:hypothetical protein